MKRAPRLQSRQRGSYLLETLIAVVLFSFGILGLVGTLASSVRATNDARYRSEAANLAGAMVADMWATAPAQLDAQFGASGVKLTAWQNRAASLLPYAGAIPPSIDLTQPGLSSQSRTVIVKVFWQMPGASELHQYILTAQIGKNS
jgi:type IV pilus assembly protein PilV